MKKKFFRFLCILSAAALPFACSDDEGSPEAALLHVDETDLSVPADAALLADPFGEETPAVTDTVWIQSTRSWTAAAETSDGGDWMHISTGERINVTGQVEKFPLVVTFDRYRGSRPRTATLTIYGMDIEEPLEIHYTQKAYVPTVEISADGDGIVTADGGEVSVIVRANTSWTASIDESASTVIPSLSATAGSGTQAILVTFPQNPDDEKARIARLVIQASGCEDRTLELIQTQSERFFFLASPVAEQREPYESSINIPLRSNGPWNATISDCTFENAVLTPSSGLVSYGGLTFSADHGADPEVEEKHATITLVREGMEPIVVKLSQRGSIHLKICSFDPEYEFTGSDYFNMDTPYRPYASNGQPFSYPTSFPNTFSAETYKGVEVNCETRAGGYVFTLYGQDCGAWLSYAELGLCIGKRKGDYVAFPAIEGYRLSAMYYEASCKVSTPYTVRTEEGSILSGGEYSVTRQVVPLTSEHHDVHEHHFSGTLAGERCRLTLEEDLRFISIKELCLVYEK